MSTVDISQLPPCNLSISENAAVKSTDTLQKSSESSETVPQQIKLNFDRIDLEDKQAKLKKEQQEIADNAEYGRIAKTNPVFASLNGTKNVLNNCAESMYNLLDRYNLYNENIAYYQNMLNGNNSSSPLSETNKQTCLDKLADLQDKREYLMEHGYPKGESANDMIGLPTEMDLLEIRCRMALLSDQPDAEEAIAALSNSYQELSSFHLPTSNFETDIKNAISNLQSMANSINVAWNKYKQQENEPNAPSSLTKITSHHKKQYSDPVKTLLDIEDPMNDLLNNPFFQRVARLHEDEFITIPISN